MQGTAGLRPCKAGVPARGRIMRCGAGRWLKAIRSGSTRRRSMGHSCSATCFPPTSWRSTEMRGSASLEAGAPGRS